MSAEYIAVYGRLSYKRDGRHGGAWFVGRRQESGWGSLAKCDTKAEAQAVVDALTAGAIRPDDEEAMRRIVRAVRSGAAA